MAVVGPLVSKGGNTYKAFVVSSIFSKAQTLALYLNCSNAIAKAKVSLPTSKAVFREVQLKVKFKYFTTVKHFN